MSFTLQARSSSRVYPYARKAASFAATMAPLRRSKIHIGKGLAAGNRHLASTGCETRAVASGAAFTSLGGAFRL
jgi:hypothetical protein